MKYIVDPEILVPQNLHELRINGLLWLQHADRILEPTLKTARSLLLDHRPCAIKYFCYYELNESTTTSIEIVNDDCRRFKSAGLLSFPV